MMRGTLITKDNKALFMKTVDAEVREDCDVFIGVYDEDTDTACGVLAAEAAGGHTLSIRHIFVDPDWRGKGAGTELIETLRDVALNLKAGAIICTYNRGNGSEGISELLESQGFVCDPDLTYPIFMINLTDLETEKSKKPLTFISLKEIDNKTWKDLSDEWEKVDGDEDGLDALMEDRERYDPDRSCLAFDKNDILVGMFLVVCHGGEYMLEAFYALGDDAPGVEEALLGFVSDMAAGGKLKDTFLTVCPITPGDRELFSRITGGAMIQVGGGMHYSLELIV